MNEVRVRPGERADYPVLARIYRAASLSNDGDRQALLDHPETLVLDTGLIRRGRTRVATLADGNVVGFASTTHVEFGALELDDLFTDPDVRRRGVARRLVAQIVAEARTEGVQRIEVTANPHALGFYRAAGFVEVGLVSTEFGPGTRMRLDV